MGADDQFHKRKARESKRLERKKAKRSAYEKVLIVCEGEKTEPNYFNELIQFYELNTANVAVDGTSGSSPRSVYERAVKLSDNEAKKGDPYDRVYCVFDKDKHETYNETLKKISNKKPKGKFYYAVSIPCFEYWLLLHFKYTTSPYAAIPGSSVGHAALKDLKKHMPEYEKGSNNNFVKLINKLDFAKENAAKSMNDAINNSTDNPSTNIHILIEYLQNIKI